MAQRRASRRRSLDNIGMIYKKDDTPEHTAIRRCAIDIDGNEVMK